MQVTFCFISGTLLPLVINKSACLLKEGAHKTLNRDKQRDIKDRQRSVVKVRGPWGLSPLLRFEPPAIV